MALLLYLSVVRTRTCSSQKTQPHPLPEKYIRGRQVNVLVPSAVLLHNDGVEDPLCLLCRPPSSHLAHLALTSTSKLSILLGGLALLLNSAHVVLGSLEYLTTDELYMKIAKRDVNGKGGTRDFLDIVVAYTNIAFADMWIKYEFASVRYNCELHYYSEESLRHHSVITRAFENPSRNHGHVMYFGQRIERIHGNNFQWSNCQRDFEHFLDYDRSG